MKKPSAILVAALASESVAKHRAYTHGWIVVVLFTLAAFSVFAGGCPQHLDWDRAMNVARGVRHLVVTIDSPRLMVNHLLRVDLREKGLRVVGTGRAAEWGRPTDVIFTRSWWTDAINMDGGGSSTLVYWDESKGRPVVSSRHDRSRTKYRDVAANLGIVLEM